MDYIELLDNLFSRLVDDIGYIYFNEENKLYIVQKSGKTRIRNIYFDIKEGNFIKYSTIVTNKKIILKLKEYDRNKNLICFLPDECGYRVRVYNCYGELIYKHYIKFFDKVNWITKRILKSKYPDLCLDS